ncbi:Smr/MutS family protein [Myxococcaceae bacterium GXIMD 01537]
MSHRSGPPKKKEPSFANNPFKDAIKGIQQEQKKATAEAEAAAARSRAKPAAPAKPSKQKPAREEDDAALFFSAMDGVEQMRERGEAPAPNVRLPEIIDENAESLAQLSELVAGKGEFDVADSDEFIEGAAPGTDRNLMRALRRGDFSVQGHLDLHGLTQQEAKDAVERFLTSSRAARRRCVLIVHGRGLHSKDQVPILKERLKVWLSQKRIGQMVLAFATARPHDGGAGAVYVLLRR